MAVQQDGVGRDGGDAQKVWYGKSRPGRTCDFFLFSFFSPCSACSEAPTPVVDVVDDVVVLVFVSTLLLFFFSFLQSVDLFESGGLYCIPLLWEVYAVLVAYGAREGARVKRGGYRGVGGCWLPQGFSIFFKHAGGFCESDGSSYLIAQSVRNYC